MAGPDRLDHAGRADRMDSGVPARYRRLLDAGTQPLARVMDVVQVRARSQGRTRGLRLSFGAVRCILCHGGPRLSRAEFADAGVPQCLPGAGMDSGRLGGGQRVRASGFNRLGRFNDGGAEHGPQAVLTQHLVVLTQHLAAQRCSYGEFRVPGLRHLGAHRSVHARRQPAPARPRGPAGG